MIRLNEYRLTIIITLVALSFMSGFLYYFERVEYNRYTGFRGEARYNPFLAMSLLLKDYDYQVSHKPTFTVDSDMPVSNSLLFLSDINIYKHTALTDKLLNWVYEGGSLIITGHSDITQKDKHYRLFNKLDVTFETTASDIKGASSYELHKTNYELDLYHFNVITTQHAKLWQVKDEHGTHIANLAVGKGSLIILNNAYFLQNSNLAKHDHAQFILDIIQPLNIKNIWYSSNVTDRSFFSRLSEFPLVIISFVLLLMCFVLFYIQRFGPVFISESSEHIDLTRYFKATGNYLWKNGYHMHLYTAAKNNALDRVRFHIPGWNSLDQQQQVSCLYELTNIQHEILAKVLVTEKITSKKEFFNLMKTLETIRDKL